MISKTVVGAICTCLAVVSLHANAALITYRLEGVIQDSVEPLLVVGASYSAVLLFDPSVLASSPDSNGGLSYSPASFSFTSGDASLSGNSMSIAIDNSDAGAGSDVVRVDGALTGSFTSNLRINLVNHDGTLFSSNAFPDPFPTLADFDSGQLLINTNTTNFASLDVFEPVPIPGAVWLFGSALIGLVGLARRRTHA